MKKQLDDKQQADQAKALAFHAKLAELAKLSTESFPVMTRDRHITRKDQAKLARKLFAEIGLKGISVTSPNYSMAQSVDVRIPARLDYDFDAAGFVIEGDEARKANNWALDSIRALLAISFPNHDDRSDSQSDHFDFKWSISGS